MIIKTFILTGSKRTIVRTAAASWLSRAHTHTWQPGHAQCRHYLVVRCPDNMCLHSPGGCSRVCVAVVCPEKYRLCAEGLLHFMSVPRAYQPSHLRLLSSHLAGSSHPVTVYATLALHMVARQHQGQTTLQLNGSGQTNESSRHPA